MEKKAVSGMMLTLLLVSMLTLAFNIQPAKTKYESWTVKDDLQDYANENKANDQPTSVYYSAVNIVDEWPMSHHDERNTEHSLDTIIYPPFTKLWEYEAGHFAVSRPVASHDAVFLARFDGAVLKLNAANGSKIWEKNLGYSVSGLALGQGLVFASVGNGTFRALDENTGEIDWTFTGTEYKGFGPAVYIDGIVYVGSDDFNVYAFYANNGTEKWRFTTESWLNRPVAVSNGIVFTGDTNKRLYAIDADKGTEKWRFPAVGRLGYYVDSPIVANGIVYALADRLYAIDVQTGNELWNASVTIGRSLQHSAIAYGIIYAISGTRVEALNATNGKLIWDYTYPETGDWFDLGIMVANRIVYASFGREASPEEHAFTLMALAAFSGSPVWQYTTDMPGALNPIIANGRLYAVSYWGNKTYCFAPVAFPDFSIMASPTALTIQRGGSDTSVITITSISGFNQPVQLTVYRAPSGVTATLSPDQVTPPPDGSTTSTLTVLVATAATLGRYTFSVIGTNGTLAHDVAITLEITALPPPENQPPVADSGKDLSVVSGASVLFNGSGSYDPDGTLVGYQWNFGDDTTAEGRMVNHRFRGAQNEPKIYTVTLIVEDDKGAKDTDTVYVTVSPLEKTVEASYLPPVPIPGQQVFGKMTVTYNWIQDTDYVVSKIHYKSEGFLGFGDISIWDTHSHVVPTPRWAAAIPSFGRTEKTYSPKLDEVQYGGDTFEGISVEAFDAMNIYIIGWAGISFSIGIPPAPFFETASACFEPDSTEVPEIPIEVPDLFLTRLDSPGELRVYDSQGVVTGLVNGEVKEEIPNSVYSNNTVVILSPSGTYRHEVAGTEDGSYGLLVASFVKGESNTFTATDIPISAKAIHEYTVDWYGLSQGEEGVTVQIDSDGDGTFEKTFTVGSELTRDEFMLQVPPIETFPTWIVGVAVATIAIATATIAVFWRRRKQPPKKG